MSVAVFMSVAVVAGMSIGSGVSARAKYLNGIVCVERSAKCALVVGHWPAFRRIVVFA